MTLTDLQEPVRDGFAATQLIRKYEANTGTHIIIVALTANDAEGIWEQCLQAVIDDFIHTPLTLAKLDNLLKKCLKDS